MSLNNVCRLCLSKDKLVWVFDKRFESNMIHRIFMTTGVEISLTDAVSQYICEICCPRVINMYNFRKQALENDKQLKETLKNGESSQSLPAVQIKAEKNDETEQKNKRSLPIHPTIQEVYNLYPNIKIMRMCINSNIKPFVVMPLGKVENYYKERNLNFEEHCRLALEPKVTARKRTLSSSKAVHVRSPCSIKGRIIEQMQDNKEDGVVRPIKIKIIPKISQVSKNILKMIDIDNKPKVQTDNTEPSHKKIKYSDTEHSSVKENEVSNGIQPLALVTNISTPLFTCDICDSVQYNLKDLKKHRYNHLRCQFCKSTCRSLEDKSEHLKGCLIKTAMNNIPSIELSKVETDTDVVEKFPTAFTCLSSTTDDNIEFHEVQSESESECLEISSKPLEESTTKTIVDVIEILSDDDDIPTTSTNDTSIKKPKPITIKPDVIIKDSPFKDIVIPKSNEIQMLTDLLKISQSLHMSATEKSVQTDVPNQQGVEVDECDQTALLTNLQHDLQVYKIPVVIKNGSFAVSYGHMDEPKTKKLELWNDLAAIDIKKKTPKHSAAGDDSSPALSPPTTTGVTTPITDKESCMNKDAASVANKPIMKRLEKRDELVAVNIKSNIKATTAKLSTDDNSSLISKDAKSSVLTPSTIANSVQNTLCHQDSSLNKAITKQLEMWNDFVAKKITNHVLAATTRHSALDAERPHARKAQTSLIPTTESIPLVDVDRCVNENTRRSPLCVKKDERKILEMLNIFETNIKNAQTASKHSNSGTASSSASKEIKSSLITSTAISTSIVDKESFVNKDTPNLPVSNDGVMMSASKAPCEYRKSLITFEIGATVSPDKPTVEIEATVSTVGSTHSHISVVGPSAVSTFPSLKTTSQPYPKHAVVSAANQATTASEIRVKTAATWKPPPVIRSPKFQNITRPKSAEEIYLTASKNMSTSESLNKPPVFSPPSMSFLYPPNTSVYDIPNIFSQMPPTSTKSTISDFRNPHLYKESQLHSNSNRSFKETQNNYNVSTHSRTTLSGYSKDLGNRNSHRPQSTTHNTPNLMQQQFANTSATEHIYPLTTSVNSLDNNLRLSSTFTTGSSNVPVIAVDKSKPSEGAQRYSRYSGTMNSTNLSHSTMHPNNLQYVPDTNKHISRRNSLPDHTWKMGQPPSYSETLIALANNIDCGLPQQAVTKTGERGNPVSSWTNSIMLPQHSSNTPSISVNQPSVSSPKTCQTSAAQAAPCSVTAPRFGNIRVRNMQELI